MHPQPPANNTDSPGGYRIHKKQRNLEKANHFIQQIATTMRYTGLLLASCFLLCLFSCKKDTLAPPSSFAFQVGNKSYSWSFEPDSPRLEKGALLKKVITSNSSVPVYVLDGWSYPDGIRIEAVLNTPSLAVNSYKRTQALSDPFVESLSNFDNTQFGTVTGDYISVNITNISGRYASGTFYAVMHDLASSTKELRIFNGSFNHILIED